MGKLFSVSFVLVGLGGCFGFAALRCKTGFTTCSTCFGFAETRFARFGETFGFSFAETRFARFGETFGFGFAETRFARFQTALSGLGSAGVLRLTGLGRLKTVYLMKQAKRCFQSSFFATVTIAGRNTRSARV
ncbi:hypothetical protein L4G92_03730 [Neisseria sp. ZJ106]|uniref:Lipoprotein n=1 Tax=Neisseria lisongii TaxID=2912188 RepID=A0ABY7RJ50_9NEIS|nr:hypothetical protein [Neisseria lisongii]MCF7521162.1 hypothetical protein [Neisseria lisongii]WCL71657.1 hypothetical protein PJU73_00570 [Neisseria lisongii]